MMKIKKILIAFFLMFGTFAVSHISADNVNYNVVPLPNKITVKKAKPFELNANTKILYYPKNNKDMERNAQFLSDYLFELTGLRLQATTSGSKSNAIILNTALKAPQTDAYKLTVNNRNIVISGKSPAAVFYGIQTLRKSTPVSKVQSLNYPAVDIFDYAQFTYRGMHLDVGRHYQPVEFIKKFIDVLALHNNNKFHWHLTEDQGWRLEIKKYPKLTEVGAWRKETVIGRNSGKFDGIPHGGFYTQDQIRDIVQYAKERYITIIPEIDLPGHMLAAMAAYPEFGCTGGPYEVQRQWGIFDDVLCAGQEKTYKFLEDILSEVMELFPSEYIHIGGDECPKTRWKECPRCQQKIKELGLKDDSKHEKEFYLQSYVTERIEKFLNDHGRQIIGWDEILEGKLAPNATVMSWRGTKGGIEAAEMGHDVVMTPNTYAYFDYYQTANTKDEPLAIGGYLPIERVYGYNPYEGIPQDKQKHILGVQANVWTEYMKTADYIEYMTMPRIAAMAEIQWMKSERKDYKDFIKRLPQLLKLYDKLNYNYATHVYDIQSTFSPNTENRTLDVLLTTIDNAPIYITTDGSEPTKQSILYTHKVGLKESADFKAKAIRANGKNSKTLSQKIELTKSSLKPIKLLTQPSENYAFAGAVMLNDGLKATSENYRTGRWIGFQGTNLEAVIDLEQQIEISTATIRNCVVTGDWIMDAASICLFVSDDGTHFSKVAGIITNPNDRTKHWSGISTHTITFKPLKTRYVKVIVRPFEKFPQWHGGNGKPYIFVDEIMID